MKTFFFCFFFLEIARKIFVKTFFFFFFWRALALVSLALASSIPVLGLESVCPRKGCPWPWPRIFFVSLALALASSLVSSTQPLVNRQVDQRSSLVAKKNSGHSQLSQNVDSSLIYEESKVRRPSGFHLPLGLKSRVHYRVGDTKLNATKNDNSQLLCFKLKIEGRVW